MCVCVYALWDKILRFKNTCSSSSSSSSSSIHAGRVWGLGESNARTHEKEGQLLDSWNTSGEYTRCVKVEVAVLGSPFPWSLWTYSNI